LQVRGYYLSKRPAKPLPNRIIDNATIEAYNPDSKHRITKDAHV